MLWGGSQAVVEFLFHSKQSVVGTKGVEGGTCRRGRLVWEAEEPFSRRAIIRYDEELLRRKEAEELPFRRAIIRYDEELLRRKRNQRLDGFACLGLVEGL